MISSAGMSDNGSRSLFLRVFQRNQEKTMNTRNYGKNRGRSRDITATIETHVQNCCADLHAFINLAIYLN